MTLIRRAALRFAITISPRNLNARAIADRVPLAGPEKVINHQSRFVNLPQTRCKKTNKSFLSQEKNPLKFINGRISMQRFSLPPPNMRPRGYLSVQRKTNSGQSNFRHHY
jgi:hypothetical protein